MAYEKQTWQTGETITAQKLNHMEDGIASGGGFLITLTPSDEEGETTGTIDKTYSEIFSAIESGQIPLMNMVVSDDIVSSLPYNTMKNGKIIFRSLSIAPVMDGDGLTVNDFEVHVLPNDTLEEHDYTGTIPTTSDSGDGGL